MLVRLSVLPRLYVNEVELTDEGNNSSVMVIYCLLKKW